MMTSLNDLERYIQNALQENRDVPYNNADVQMGLGLAQAVVTEAFKKYREDKELLHARPYDSGV